MNLPQKIFLSVHLAERGISSHNEHWYIWQSDGVRWVVGNMETFEEYLGWKRHLTIGGSLTVSKKQKYSSRLASSWQFLSTFSCYSLYSPESVVSKGTKKLYGCMEKIASHSSGFFF